MDVWEVFSRRTHDDPLTHVGSIKAPDREVALLMAREAFFRHGEGVDCWVGRRSDLYRIPDPGTLGGVTDKTYRRSEGYAGIGAKHKRMRDEIAAKGMRIDGVRPSRGGAAEAPDRGGAVSPGGGAEDR